MPWGLGIHLFLHVYVHVLRNYSLIFFCAWSIKYEWVSNSSLWLVDQTRTGTTTLGLSGPESKGKFSLYTSSELSATLVPNPSFAGNVVTPV